MSESVASKLGAKLADLKLTEEEAILLVELLGGVVDSEVQGFSSPQVPNGGTGDINILRPIVGTSMAGGDWFIADSFSFGVEREMG